MHRSWRPPPKLRKKSYLYSIPIPPPHNHQCLATVCCRRLWDRPEYLSALLSAVQQRAVTWVRAQKRHHGTSWGRPSLGSLLQGFFDFYSDIMTSWVLGKRRWACAAT